MTTLALTAILAAALVPLIRRGLRRTVARQRHRAIRTAVENLRQRSRVTITKGNR